MKKSTGIKGIAGIISPGNGKDHSLPLMEMYYTIQGEGQHTGKPAFFIRLGGCDVGCVWCDVKESWNAENHPAASIKKMVAEAAAHPSRFAVITGGEPCMYNLASLCNELHKKKFTIALETSGAYSIRGKFDWICVSPKKFKFPLRQNLRKADELKVIVYNKSDFQWAEKNAENVNSDCKLFLQPEYSVFERVMPQIIQYVKQNPRWKISLQTHKILRVP